MTYRIEGLARAEFARWFGRSDEALAAEGVVRVTADSKPGFPCRVTLEDAEPGETLLLLNYVDHDVATPFRNSFGIYVRESAAAAAVFEDTLPPVFVGRPIALRAYDVRGMLCAAALATGDDKDEQIRALFGRPEIAYIHAHNAAHGCFTARIERRPQLLSPTAQ